MACNDAPPLEIPTTLPTSTQPKFEIYFITVVLLAVLASENATYGVPLYTAKLLLTLEDD